MVTPLWQSLKELVNLDLKLQAVQSHIAQAQEEIVQDNQVLPELQATIDEIRQAIMNAKKHVDLQELNAKDLKEQEEKKRLALDNVANQKEYAALEKELGSLLVQASEQDDALVKAWHTLDLARKKEANETAALEEQMATVKKDAVQKQEAITALKNEYKQLEATKKSKTQAVPEEWLTKYERMRSKVADPIVPIIGTSCSSCYYSVPSQDMTRLKNHAILPCRSCYRLLYHDTQEEKDLQESSF